MDKLNLIKYHISKFKLNNPGNYKSPELLYIKDNIIYFSDNSNADIFSLMFDIRLTLLGYFDIYNDFLIFKDINSEHLGIVSRQNNYGLLPYDFPPLFFITAKKYYDNVIVTDSVVNIDNRTLPRRNKNNLPVFLQSSINDFSSQGYVYDIYNYLFIIMPSPAYMEEFINKLYFYFSTNRF